ncbi:DNA repair protein RecN [Amylibacter marinus]|uniref:DNA repair protein RecN n=1 Tax=Amylibacter marinus TaxID=1475483 RepID=A0ABQ5VUL9_9RHOB|nr:DNA repair protein RecN [Amylibacter marinus]GLQ34859.1 DNA repair protein RecN [Amylibacter marinus]
MLRELYIQDMLLIDRLELDFQAGLNVLTGETGAGKSILLDSLGFVLGWRGRADLVRTGAKQGIVTASFDLGADHPAHAILSEAGLEDDGALILRRTNARDGRKTCYINDRRCSGEILRRLSETLVELHGQHDDRGLLNPRGHRQLLDTFAGIDLGDIRAIWRKRAALAKQLQQAQATLAEAEKDQDFLAHALDELEKLAPEPNEEEALDAKRRLMQGAEKIRADVARAFDALGGQGAEAQITDAQRWLEGALDAADGRLDAPSDALSRALNELGEAQRGVEDCLRALTFDPLELEATEERLFAIRALARKHNILPADLAGFGADLAQKLRAIETGGDEIARLHQALVEAEAEYDQEAKILTLARQKAGQELARAMDGELAPLKLDRAEFVVQVSDADAGQDGVDDVTFMVATNPGAPAGAINKIASGGELSRFLLALKVCLTRNAQGLTLIFDEIDRGVGGATADAVGSRLSEIAKNAQVLVVTHSPQVAAKGAHHWQVSKSVIEGITHSRVIKMEDQDRVDEVARMLAGDSITPEARAAARALMSP